MLVFLSFFLLCAIILSYTIDNGLKKSNLIPYKVWNDILNSKINADLIILGSSRAYLHFSPQIIDSAFNVNSYNLALDGKPFRIQYYRLMLYLKHNKKPKFIIQNVDNGTLSRDLADFDSQFLPYLGIKEIDDAVKTYRGINWKDKYIPMYKYHGNYELIVKGFMGYMNISYTQKNSEYKGFLTHNKSWDSSFSNFLKINPHGWYQSIDRDTKELFERYLELCKAENIKIIFVYTPEYYEAQKLSLSRDSITNIFKNYGAMYKIPFFDYSNSSICLNKTNFYNSQHLNTTGVIKFNSLLSHDLKSIIKE